MKLALCMRPPLLRPPSYKCVPCSGLVDRSPTLVLKALAASGSLIALSVLAAGLLCMLRLLCAPEVPLLYASGGPLPCARVLCAREVPLALRRCAVTEDAGKGGWSENLKLLPALQLLSPVPRTLSPCAPPSNPAAPVPKVLVGLECSSPAGALPRLLAGLECSARLLLWLCMRGRAVGSAPMVTSGTRLLLWLCAWLLRVTGAPQLLLWP
eukprot:1044091-Pelagomonas_calceolata.AAC.5